MPIGFTQYPDFGVANAVLLYGDQTINGTKTFTSSIQMFNNSGIRLFGINGVNYVELKASASMSTTYAISFPLSSGVAGDVLSVSSGGSTYWGPPMAAAVGDITGTIASGSLRVTAVNGISFTASAQINAPMIRDANAGVSIGSLTASGINNSNSRMINFIPGVRVVNGTTDQITVADCGNTVLYTSSSLCTVTLSSNSVLYQGVTFFRLNGSVTFVASTNSVRISSNGFTGMRSLNSVMSAFVQEVIGSTSYWNLYGDGI